MEAGPPRTEQPPDRSQRKRRTHRIPFLSSLTAGKSNGGRRQHVPRPLSQVTADVVASNGADVSHSSVAQESEMGLAGLNARLGRAGLLLELQARIRSCLFCPPWVKVPSSVFKANISLTLLPPSYKDPCDNAESLGNLGSAPMSRSADQPPLLPFATRSSRIRMWASLGGIIPPTTSDRWPLWGQAVTRGALWGCLRQARSVSCSECSSG